MSVINTNYLALVSQNNLTKSQGALGTAIERLSSGLRINSAKDDAAGQAIANRFTANIKGLTQAARNANDGISIAQTTEGSLNEINNNLQRVRELSVQAANGSNSQTDLDSIQAEIRERLEEIDRVSRETQFNGKYVLGDDAGELSIQVGAHDNQRIHIDLKRIDSNTLGLGSYNVNSSANNVTTVDVSKSGAAGSIEKDVTVLANSGLGSNQNPSGSGITAEATNGKVDVYAVDGGGYAVKASDGNFYEVTENNSTGKWNWDTSDTNSIVAAGDITGGPLASQEHSVTVDTTDVAAGFVDAASGAGANVTLTGTGGGVTIDHTGLNLTTNNFDANASVNSVAYNEGNGKYYLEITGDTTTAGNNGYYEATVAADGTVTFTGTANDGTGGDNLGSALPSGATTVTTTPVTSAVEIDFNAGLFGRNDVAAKWDDATNTMTQQYAAKGTDNNYYAVTATFELKASATAGSTNIADYDVSYTIDVSAGGATQLSESNVDIAGGALQELTVAHGDFVAPEQDDLYNLEYTITADTNNGADSGLYAVEGGGYAVKGSDGRFYAANLDEDSGDVSWDSTDNTSVIADLSKIDQSAAVDSYSVTVDGQFDTSALASDETLVSYEDEDGNTNYLIQTGTGKDATYSKAIVADADAQGNIVVTKDTGDDAAVRVRTTDPLAALDEALQQVDSLRSHLGAIQNRFESTIANLSNTTTNLSAARSRIEDADYAVEVSNMTRAQILQQAGTSVLAQANQVPQTVLSLLR